MMRSSCASMLMLCLLVLHCQRGRAVRAKTGGMATELSSAQTNRTRERFDINKCLPHPLPFIDMKMCLHVTTDGEFKPIPPGLYARFKNFWKAPPFDAEKHIKERGGKLLADKAKLPEVATFNLQPALFGCDSCKNELLSGMATTEHTEVGDKTSYPYMPLMKVERAVKRGKQDPFSPHCTDVVKLVEDFVKNVPLFDAAKKRKAGPAQLRSQYCVYMAEHEFNEEITTTFGGVEPIKVTFPSDQICIDHLWSATLVFGEFGEVAHNLIAPSPLMCWSRKEVEKDGFNVPEMPWLSEKYKKGLAGVVDGISDLLQGCFTKSDMRGKVELANGWCTDYGVKEFYEVIESKDAFMKALSLNSGETDQMVKRFELTDLLSGCFGNDAVEKLKLANAWCTLNAEVYDVHDVSGIIENAEAFMQALQLKPAEKTRMERAFEKSTLPTESDDKRD